MLLDRIPDWWRHGGWRLVLSLIAASAMFAIGLLYELEGQRSLAHHNCLRINRLEAALTTILQASEAALPANRYYRTHPAELAHAERQLRRDLQLIRQARCLN